jgi:hypothetical protein
MAAANPTTNVNVLKRIWGPDVEKPLFKRCKLAMLCKKDTKFGGEGRYVIVEYNATTGGSSDYATAVANEGTNATKRFFVTRRKEYQVFSIDGEMLEAAKEKGESAVLDIVKNQGDSAMYAWGRAVAAKLWGNGGGALGRLAAGTTLTGATFTFRNEDDHRRLEVGQKIVFALADGSAATADPSDVLDSGEALTVTAINRSTKVVTVSANLNTIASITEDAYVFREGDYARSITGLPGWNPQVAPSASESFFGVDRSTGDTQRLSGLIYDSSGDSNYESVIIGACAEAAMLGIEIRQWFTDPISFGKITKETGLKKEVMVNDSKYGIGFKTLEIYGQDGPIQVIADADCPVDQFWATNTDQLHLRSAGEFPKQLTDPGKGGWLRRKENSDEVRGSLGGYANFFNDNPGNGVQGVYAI